MNNPLLQPMLQKVEPKFGDSFVVRSFSGEFESESPKWHFHPEIEIIYIEKGKGKRHIGNNMSHFNNGDLLLIGSNLPHYGFPSRLTGKHEEIVLQISESHFVGPFLDMQELAPIKILLQKSKMGLSFYGDTKNKVGELLKSMLYMDGFEKIIALLKIFRLMAASEELNELNATGQSLIVNGSDMQRIDIIYRLVRKNFQKKLPLDIIAQEVNMTVPALCRFFKKSTSKTFIQFLNEFRVAHACNLLSEDQDSIANISYECGFQNISNFNRAFKKTTGISPSEFRNKRKLLYT